MDAFKNNLGPCHRSPLIRSFEIFQNHITRRVITLTTRMQRYLAENYMSS
jgi:hypothetical protein